MKKVFHKTLRFNKGGYYFQNKYMQSTYFKNYRVLFWNRTSICSPPLSAVYGREVHVRKTLLGNTEIQYPHSRHLIPALNASAAWA